MASDVTLNVTLLHFNTHTKLTCFISFLYKSEFTLYNYSSQNKICSAAHNMSNEL